MFYCPLFNLGDFVIDTLAQEKRVNFLNNLLNKKRKQINDKNRDKFNHTYAPSSRGRQGKIVRRTSQTRRG